MEIREHHVLITGANRGIGRALAQMCAENGAHLHLAIRQEEPGLVSEFRDAGAASVTTWVCDLGHREGVEDLLSRLRNQTIDLLINNAGRLTGGQLEEQPLDEIYRMFQVNLLSLVQLTRGLLPGMIARGRGKIVNNSSVTAFMPFPGASTYAASKAAVAVFTDCLRGELKSTPVTTLCLITPGVKTRMYDEISEKYGENFDTRAMGGGLSSPQYAKMVREAILLDLEVLEPKGLTGLGLMLAKYATPVFRWEIQRRFQRKGPR